MPFNYLELITCQENRFYNIPVYCVGIARVSYDNNNSGIPYYFRAGRSDIDLCISEIWYPLGLFNALYRQAVKAFNQHIFNTFIINQAYNSHCPWAEIENQSLSRLILNWHQARHKSEGAPLNYYYSSFYFYSESVVSFCKKRPLLQPLFQTIGLALDKYTQNHYRTSN